MCSYEDISKQSFELAFNLAQKKLANMTREEICFNSGALPVLQDKVVLQYLNRPYRVTVSTGEISTEDEKENVPIKDQILILHYLTQAKGKLFTDKLITYGQIEGGKFYIPAFIQRNIQPLLKCFGHRPELLLEVAPKIGGTSATHGDVSIRIDAFPRVRIFFILWKGDDEVAPNGTILFDGNIPDYLTSEDVCVLTETIVWKLVRMAA